MIRSSSYALEDTIGSFVGSRLAVEDNSTSVEEALKKKNNHFFIFHI